MFLCVQEEEEEGIGDVDLFTLSDDHQTLTVNAKWLQHLQASFLVLMPASFMPRSCRGWSDYKEERLPIRFGQCIQKTLARAYRGRGTALCCQVA